MYQSPYHHFRIWHIVAAVIAGLVLAVSLKAFASFYVSGAALPTSVGSPTTDQGVSLAARSVNLTNLVLHNTDSADHTVKVLDCSGTPFYLIGSAAAGVPITAGSTWTISWAPPGVRMQGCFKWVASDATVEGALSGQ